MTTTYKILDFDSHSEKVQEPMGTKRKYWVDQVHESEVVEWLFKVPREGTGEHWAEKVAYELAALINLPAARVELATLFLEGRKVRGSASCSFTPPNVTLFHGNELLDRVVPDYDKEKRYGQLEHRIDAIFDAIALQNLASAPGAEDLSAVQCFVGYIVFDAWIANVDRHHENWGMLADSIDRIAPTFDHASSLGRLLPDEKRTKILNGEVYRLNLEQFLTRRKAHGAIFPRQGNQGVPPWKLVSDLKQMGHANDVLWWLDRIDMISDTQLGTIFSAFPSGWLSDPAIRFATEILKTTPKLMRREIAQ